MTYEIHAQQDQLSAESGQTMVEYSLALGVVLVVTIATFTLLGGRIEQMYGLVTEVFAR